jgi:DNA-binding FadR family transcriptional regulator
MTVQAQLKPIKRKKLYEEIVEQLEQMMVRGQLAPGDNLPSERELMDQFAVGRTSVREALFALQKMGLITVRNGEKAFVTKPSANHLISELSGAARHMLSTEEGVREFQEARVLMETALTRNAARQATANDIDRLSSALAKNKLALDDIVEFAATDVVFHYEIAKINGNTIFEALHSAASGWLSEQRLISLRAPGATKSAFQAHKSIFEAIVARDPDAAEVAMAEHLANVTRFYWKAKT